MSDPVVTTIIMNNMGGITSMTRNVISFRGTAALTQKVILLDKKDSNGPKFIGKLVEGVDQEEISFSTNDNLYHFLKKVFEAIPKGKGVLVSNDFYDLLMLTRFNTGKKVIQIVHDGYNVGLSLKYEDVVDAFICHSKFFYEVLCQLLPTRRKDIYYLPYGIPRSETKRRSNHNGRLKCLFLGRLTNEKGVLYLKHIDNQLRQDNVSVDWMIIGKGRDEKQVRDQWEGSDNVNFHAPKSQEELINLCAQNDAFVFPTTFEGFPVALLETMSVGCVPVVSDLPGGIREIVSDKIGYLCKPGDHSAFVHAIKLLNNDRVDLENKSKCCVSLVEDSFDARIQSPKYQQSFIEILADSHPPKHHNINRGVGSRLDKSFIPNFVTKAIREVRL